ncbi:hypothetical protein [Streptococcus suis]|uniref:Uncharacterized protein n=1 Tax=Streptococcus suis TaxID=1307 RepID=A0A0Z8DW44_STRSU|nr:hypothetical protein [Streptococcus suis]MCR1233108.1 hypothetical protein [Streptococcus suis]NQH63558.1 hypothetical protein [Streptococcus suis]CYU51283.1 Uncharacterised protein [Streptococcus suis]CYU54049.1 Uncharacterised protein [Streptococcus suis]HEL1564977.1 hypothetical protein [Streptococcus suis]
MEYIEEYVDKPMKLILITVFEFIISWLIYTFKHNQEIISIRQQKLGALLEAFKIVQVEGYYIHLLFGLLWAVVLIAFIFWGFRERKFIASLIYIFYLIIFWWIFWDPIVTTFLTISIAGGLIVMSMDS